MVPRKHEQLLVHAPVGSVESLAVVPADEVVVLGVEEEDREREAGDVALGVHVREVESCAADDGLADETEAEREERGEDLLAHPRVALVGDLQREREEE